MITEIIVLRSGLKVDDILNLEEQFEYKSNDLERTFDLSNQLQDRLDNILLLMKQNNRPFNEKPIEQIPNDPLSNEKPELKLEIFLLMIIILIFFYIFQRLLWTIEKILNEKQLEAI